MGLGLSEFLERLSEVDLHSLLLLCTFRSLQWCNWRERTEKKPICFERRTKKREKTTDCDFLFLFSLCYCSKINFQTAPGDLKKIGEKIHHFLISLSELDSLQNYEEQIIDKKECFLFSMYGVFFHQASDLFLRRVSKRLTGKINE